MNKIQYLTLLIFIVTSSILNNLQSQCVVCIDAPPLITCGESATLLGEGYITSAYSDDFNNNWSHMKNARNTTSGLVNSKNINPKLALDTRFVVYEIVDPIIKLSGGFISNVTSLSSEVSSMDSPKFPAKSL